MGYKNILDKIDDACLLIAVITVSLCVVGGILFLWGIGLPFEFWKIAITNLAISILVHWLIETLN